MKTKKLIRLCLILCVLGLLLSVVGFLGGGMDYIKNTDINSWDVSENANAPKYALDKTKLEKLSSLNVSMDNLDFVVKPSGDDNFYLSYKISGGYKDAPLSYNVSDGCLNISENARSSSIVYIDVNFLINAFTSDTITQKNDEVVLYVPEGTTLTDSTIDLEDGALVLSQLAFTNSTIEAGYGDVVGNDLTLSGSKLLTNDGDMVLSATNCQNTTIQSDYGSITLNGNHLSDSTVTTNEGDIDASSLRCEKIVNVSSDYGDIVLALSNPENLAITADSDYGDIVPSFIQGTLTTGSDKAHFTNNLTNATGSLTVKTNDGDIVFK